MNGYGGGGSINGHANAAAPPETIAAAIASVQGDTDGRGRPSGRPASAQKWHWSGFWRLYGCFGYQKNRKRIGHAALSSETAESVTDALVALNSVPPAAILLPFVAPPSSPASFVPSEPPSAAHSPACLLLLTSISASMYSPPGPHSMFTIGPYVHETQLVSPPVFSTFTTEPSTAPITPPSESINTTTPASPEVPFAHFLDPNLRNTEAGHGFPSCQYEFQPYQLSPGSPVCHLISPSSGISGSWTSSPFPGREIATGLSLLQFRDDQASNVFNMDILCLMDWGSMHNSDTLTPDSMRPSPRSGVFHPLSECENTGSGTNAAIALFELPLEEVREGESNPSTLAKPGSTVPPNSADFEIDSQRIVTGNTTSNSTLDASTSTSRYFTFDEGDRKDADRPGDITGGWSGETVVEEEHLSMKDWSFPVMRPSISQENTAMLGIHPDTLVHRVGARSHQWE